RYKLNPALQHLSLRHSAGYYSIYPNPQFPKFAVEQIERFQGTLPSLYLVDLSRHIARPRHLALQLAWRLHNILPDLYPAALSRHIARPRYLALQLAWRFHNIFPDLYSASLSGHIAAPLQSGAQRSESS